MNELQIFTSEEFGQIRTVMVEDEPWMVGKDVAEALGYSNSRDALAKHVDSEDKGVATCDTLGGKQDLRIINESGFYAMVFGSKLDSAKRFKHWVTHDVLPSLRKTGHYELPHMSKQQILIATLQEQEKLSARMDKVEHTVTNVLTVDSGKQRVIQREIARRVYVRSSYDESDCRYLSEKRKLFAQIHRDIKDRFAVASYRDVKVVDYDACIGYIKNWVERKV